MRTEKEIFDDLGNLCTSAGYAHVIAYFCYRDNWVRYSEEMNKDDVAHLYSRSRLIRTEISTLIGLLIKKPVDFTLPAPDVVQSYVNDTERLLEELHTTMEAPIFAELLSAAGNDGAGVFSTGKAMREPIFYGSESAYTFQYRDLAEKKYAYDNAWLLACRGFQIGAAKDVGRAIERVQRRNLLKTLRGAKKLKPEAWTFLPGFIFTPEEVAEESGIDIGIVAKVLDAFVLPPQVLNAQFGELNDFNLANALPFLRSESNGFILFQVYSFVEALYESPFYWMAEDRSYIAAAMAHRGRFTEEFSCERLERVFGKEHVFQNVDIWESKDRKLGEIDVLVVFGDRAIVLQAKSKRLTLEARKGNDGQIKADFKKSIQDAYDQGYRCANWLRDPKHVVTTAAGAKIEFPSKLKEIYLLCVLADHYPALSFQAREFLRPHIDKVILPPLVTDVFLLDAMTEMLDSPLRLLSYINRRALYSERILASHELTILSYHLKKNLWLNAKHDMVVLEDDIATNLDLAMAVRRDGVAGKRTPDGILTRFRSTAIGHIVEQIEHRPEPATIDLGFLLLTLSEDTIDDMSRAINAISQQAKRDSQCHDFSATFSEPESGLTVHCNRAPIPEASHKLMAHCEARKYASRADSWFGLCLQPEDLSIRFGVNLDHKWTRDPGMDAATRGMSRRGGTDIRAALQSRKIGRNDACPCGSGKKYKKCCLR